MMLNRILKIIGYAHATLFFALMIPLLYTVAELSDPAGAGALYMKCLLISVPVIVTERAIKRMKNLAAYIAICVALIAGVCGITALFSTSGAYAVWYCLGMSAETFIIAFKRLQDRLYESIRKKEDDLMVAKKEEFLDTPSLTLLWYFAVIYVCGLCLNAKALCDMAFYSAIVYLFLALIAVYFRETKVYLETNERIKGIPTKRLYGVSFSMLLLFSALLLAGILPSVFLADHRQYTDIRRWYEGMKPVPYEEQIAPEFGGLWGDMGMIEPMYDSEEISELSPLVDMLFRAVSGACIFAIVYGIIRAIRQVFQEFKSSYDENGDIIEEIRAEEKSDREEMLEKGRRRADGAAEKIRRRYRKTIRKHRKDRPAPYESPAEIEEGAGLKDDEEMRQLHKTYEEVRYGNIV